MIARWNRGLVSILCLLFLGALLSAGCGGGGGAASGGRAAALPGSVGGQLALVVSGDSVSPASGGGWGVSKEGPSARLIRNLDLQLRSLDGEVVTTRSVGISTGFGETQRITISGLPLGEFLLVIRAFDADGVELGSFESPITLGSGVTTTVQLVLTPGPTPEPSPSPTPEPSPSPTPEPSPSPTPEPSPSPTPEPSPSPTPEPSPSPTPEPSPSPGETLSAQLYVAMDDEVSGSASAGRLEVASVVLSGGTASLTYAPSNVGAPPLSRLTQGPEPAILGSVDPWNRAAYFLVLNPSGTALASVGRYPAAPGPGPSPSPSPSPPPALNYTPQVMVFDPSGIKSPLDELTSYVAGVDPVTGTATSETVRYTPVVASAGLGGWLDRWLGQTVAEALAPRLFGTRLELDEAAPPPNITDMLYYPDGLAFCTRDGGGLGGLRGQLGTYEVDPVSREIRYETVSLLPQELHGRAVRMAPFSTSSGAPVLFTAVEDVEGDAGSSDGIEVHQGGPGSQTVPAQFFSFAGLLDSEGSPVLEPTDLAVDLVHARLYVSCASGHLVTLLVDPAGGTVSLPASGGVVRVGLDPNPLTAVELLADRVFVTQVAGAPLLDGGRESGLVQAGQSTLHMLRWSESGPVPDGIVTLDPGFNARDMLVRVVGGPTPTPSPTPTTSPTPTPSPSPGPISEGALYISYDDPGPFQGEPPTPQGEVGSWLFRVEPGLAPTLLSSSAQRLADFSVTRLAGAFSRGQIFGADPFNGRVYAFNLDPLNGSATLDRDTDEQRGIGLTFSPLSVAPHPTLPWLYAGGLPPFGETGPSGVAILLQDPVFSLYNDPGSPPVADIMVTPDGQSALFLSEGNPENPASFGAASILALRADGGPAEAPPPSALDLSGAPVRIRMGTVQQGLTAFVAVHALETAEIPPLLEGPEPVAVSSLSGIEILRLGAATPTRVQFLSTPIEQGFGRPTALELELDPGAGRSLLHVAFDSGVLASWEVDPATGEVAPDPVAGPTTVSPDGPISGLARLGDTLFLACPATGPAPNQLTRAPGGGERLRGTSNELVAVQVAPVPQFTGTWPGFKPGPGARSFSYAIQASWPLTTDLRPTDLLFGPAQPPATQG